MPAKIRKKLVQNLQSKHGNALSGTKGRFGVVEKFWETDDYFS